MRRIEIDPRIERAETLPGWAYTSSESYELTRERLLPRSWQFVAEAARLKAPGHVLPVSLYEGCLDEPLLLARDEADVLRCLSNVCTHRGMRVVEGEGQSRGLRCRYHGRRFGLDGRFLSMPEFGAAENFPRPQDDLPSAAWGEFGGCLFASLQPSVPFAELVAPLVERLAFVPFEDFAFDPASSRSFERGADGRAIPPART